MQEQIDGRMHPVIYVGRQSSRAEQVYHSFDLETIAVVWTLERLRPSLLGIDISVVPHCNALRGTLSKRNLTPRVGRWWLKLQGFRFSIEHGSGTSVPHANALSGSTCRGAEEKEACDGLKILATTAESSSSWIMTA